ncbi:MAG: molybdenum cofactor guanylyltransferase [Planctomycetota bacterium]
MREKVGMLVGSIILAGGRSRRMGKPKESLPFGDTTLLGRTAGILMDCTWPVVVVGRGQDQELPPLPIEVHVLADEDPGGGPLQAMATALRFLLADGELGPDDAVFVTGCDAPFATPEAIGWLAARLGDATVAMPKANGRLQPLSALYRCRVLKTIEDLLRQGVDTPRTIAEKVQSVILEERDLLRFDPELRFLTGINTPEEYEAALARARDRAGS